VSGFFISTERIRNMITRNADIDTPWSLQFDRDGTEDVAVIVDADGDDLVRSRHFWLPEGKDPVPATLASMWLMAAAPKLLAALKHLLKQTIEMDLLQGTPLTEGKQEAKAQALAAIAEATNGKRGNRGPTNWDRARWAKTALAVFTAETFSGDHPDSMDRGDLECAIGDLVADLLHLAHQEGFQPRAVLDHGDSHYRGRIARE
jgi:hypothetical protein